jgi:hypothetical protein
MAVQDEAHPCPECGYIAVHNVAVRSGKRVVYKMSVGVVDVGWHCKKCGHEWGFEVIK